MGYSDLLPYHYTLRFEPNFENFTFNGAVLVQAHVFKKTRIIEMDCADLDIRHCKIFMSSSDEGYDYITNSEPGTICTDNSWDDNDTKTDNNSNDSRKHNEPSTIIGTHDTNKDYIVIPQSSISVDSTAERLRLELPKNTRLEKKVAILVEFTGA